MCSCGLFHSVYRVVAILQYIRPLTNFNYEHTQGYCIWPPVTEMRPKGREKMGPKRTPLWRQNRDLDGMSSPNAIALRAHRAGSV